jgi:hypothetical protein
MRKIRESEDLPDGKVNLRGEVASSVPRIKREIPGHTY